MATLILTDATIWLGGYDLSGVSNRLALNYGAEMKDVTVFGNSTRVAKGGLFTVDATAGGFADYAANDGSVFDNVGVAGTVLSITPTGADTERGFSFKSVQGSYTTGETVGEVMPYELAASGQSGSPLVGGKILYPKTTVSGAANGTGVQLGAVGAAQNLYTAIHVFTAGTTADVIVESDDNSGFTTATTRSTTTVTAVGATWVTPVAGAITDDYWRVRIATVTGSFSIGVIVAIQ